MTVEQFRNFASGRPFQPFAIHVSDERSFDVHHPDAAILSKSGRTISPINQSRVIEVVDMLHVTSLRPLSSRT